MMNAISALATYQLPIVFFFYGLAFVLMGIAILAAPKKGSVLEIAEILWLLAAFGIVHGVNEWMDMWAMVAGSGPALDKIRWFTLVASYFFLFEFGVGLLCLNSDLSRSMLWPVACVVFRWYGPAVILFIPIVSIGSSDFWRTGAILTRYLLCLPGGVLCGVGFLLYFRREWDLVRRLKLTFLPYVAAVAFMAYAVFGGLVVPNGGFFPSNWLNAESFLAVVGMPVEFFRAVCAVLIGLSVGRMLRIFTWEKR